MKSLKGYLEEVVQWQGSTSRMIFDVGTRITDLKFPISSSIFKRVWPGSFRATVFHVTDAKNFPKVVKLQGKKSSISAFFEMAAHYLTTGVQTLGGVVVELDADVLVSGSQDIMSAPDKGGRRWVDLSYLQTINYMPLNAFDKVEEDLEKLIIQLITTYQPGKLGRIQNPMPHWQKLGNDLYSDKTGMRDIIKDYIDGIETILKKHQKLFGQLFYSYMKKRTTNESWDEQVVNNFKIKKVHLLPDTRGFTDLPNSSDNIKNYSQFVKELKDQKIRHAQWRDSQALEIYIRDVALKGKGSSAEAEQDKIAQEFAARQKEVLAAIGKKDDFDVSRGGKPAKIVRIK